VPEPDTVQWFDVEIPDDILAVCFKCRLAIDQEIEEHISVKLMEFPRTDFDSTLTLCCEICGSVIYQGED
jgi:hypothetical protein